VEIRRTGLLTALAVLDFVGGGFLLLAGAGSSIALFAAPGKGDVVIVIGVALAYVALGALQVAAGVGVWQLRSWGRVLQIICGFLCMPCSLLISIPALIYMFQPGVKVLFSGRRVEDLNEGELGQVAKVLQGSVVTTVIIVGAVGLGSVAFIGIIAAIAIPSLLRARVAANESAAIGDLRTIISAEVAYAGVNGGRYDTPACLMAPKNCLPNPPAVTFLSPSMVFDQPKQGYVRRFHAGVPAPGVSPTSLQSFAVTAVPVKQGQTGVRSFCVDDTGVVCAVNTGEEPRMIGASCDQTTCTPLL
jgi:type II secretory pathway pseudopilin PulG